MASLPDRAVSDRDAPASPLRLAEKPCTKCGEVKPLSEFYRNKTKRDGRHCACKVCHRASTDAAQERRRAAMGEDRFKELQRIKVQYHREITGNVTGKEYARAVWRATQVLKGRHRKEYEHLLLLARRGELTEDAS